MVTACVIGDVINSGRNYVAAINMEGWLFIFDVIATSRTNLGSHSDDGCELGGGGSSNQQAHKQAKNLDVFYDQRMPSNCKELLLADLDGDGQNELIIGLTDRVLRTYKWIRIGTNRGKFVGLHKWEFADQIGSVSLNPSRHDNCQDILVAQPGGTYAKLECYDKKPSVNSGSTSGTLSDQRHDEQQPKQQRSSSDSQNNDEDNVKTEYISKLTPEYHQLSLAQMRNHHISTEILGSIRNDKGSSLYSLIVIATLDGTLMLVNKDEILWSLQVDHQLFALSVLNSKVHIQHNAIPQSQSSCTIVPSSATSATSPGSDCITSFNSDMRDNGSQYFVACAWNGKTYIIDEERNYLRFKFDEAVSAFTAGNYYFDGQHHTSLVYATFNNQIVLYFDVISDNIRPNYLLNEILNNPEHCDVLRKLEILARKLDSCSVSDGHSSNLTNREPAGNDNLEVRLHNLLQDILYSVSEDEIMSQ